MSRWPQEDIDAVVNRLMQWGWQIVNLMHEGAKVRSRIPATWHGITYGYRRTVLEIADDPYACPDRYVDDLSKSDQLDMAIFLLGAGTPIKVRSSSSQSLSVRFDLNAGNIIACETYANFFTLTAAINRLLQLGQFYGEVVNNRGRLEYRFPGESDWTALPPI